MAPHNYDCLQGKPIVLVAFKATDMLFEDKQNGLVYGIGHIISKEEAYKPELDYSSPKSSNGVMTSRPKWSIWSLIPGSRFWRQSHATKGSGDVARALQLPQSLEEFKKEASAKGEGFADVRKEHVPKTTQPKVVASVPSISTCSSSKIADRRDCSVKESIYTAVIKPATVISPVKKKDGSTIPRTTRSQGEAKARAPQTPVKQRSTEDPIGLQERHLCPTDLTDTITAVVRAHCNTIETVTQAERDSTIAIIQAQQDTCNRAQQDTIKALIQAQQDTINALIQAQQDTTTAVIKAQQNTSASPNAEVLTSQPVPAVQLLRIQLPNTILEEQPQKLCQNVSHHPTTTIDKPTPPPIISCPINLSASHRSPSLPVSEALTPVLTKVAEVSTVAVDLDHSQQTQKPKIFDKVPAPAPTPDSLEPMPSAIVSLPLSQPLAPTAPIFVSSAIKQAKLQAVKPPTTRQQLHKADFDISVVNGRDLLKSKRISVPISQATQTRSSSPPDEQGFSTTKLVSNAPAQPIQAELLVPLPANITPYVLPTSHITPHVLPTSHIETSTSVVRALEVVAPSTSTTVAQSQAVSTLAQTESAATDVNDRTKSTPKTARTSDDFSREAHALQWVPVLIPQTTASPGEKVPTTTELSSETSIAPQLLQNVSPEMHKQDNPVEKVAPWSLEAPENGLEAPDGVTRATSKTEDKPASSKISGSTSSGVLAMSLETPQLPQPVASSPSTDTAELSSQVTTLEIPGSVAKLRDTVRDSKDDIQPNDQIQTFLSSAPVASTFPSAPSNSSSPTSEFIVTLDLLALPLPSDSLLSPTLAEKSPAVSAPIKIGSIQETSLSSTDVPPANSASTLLEEPNHIVEDEDKDLQRTLAASLKDLQPSILKNPYGELPPSTSWADDDDGLDSMLANNSSLIMTVECSTNASSSNSTIIPGSPSFPLETSSPPGQKRTNKGKQKAPASVESEFKNPVPRSKILCRNVQCRKQCPYASACHYSHNLAIGICFFHAHGHCNHGGHCRFSHDMEGHDPYHQAGGFLLQETQSGATSSSGTANPITTTRRDSFASSKLHEPQKERAGKVRDLPSTTVTVKEDSNAGYLANTGVHSHDISRSSDILVLQDEKKKKQQVEHVNNITALPGSSVKAKDDPKASNEAKTGVFGISRSRGLDAIKLLGLSTTLSTTGKVQPLLSTQHAQSIDDTKAKLASGLSGTSDGVPKSRARKARQVFKEKPTPESWGVGMSASRWGPPSPEQQEDIKPVSTLLVTGQNTYTASVPRELETAEPMIEVPAQGSSSRAVPPRRSGSPLPSSPSSSKHSGSSKRAGNVVKDKSKTPASTNARSSPSPGLDMIRKTDGEKEAKAKAMAIAAIARYRDSANTYSLQSLPPLSPTSSIIPSSSEVSATATPATQPVSQKATRSVPLGFQFIQNGHPSVTLTSSDSPSQPAPLAGGSSQELNLLSPSHQEQDDQTTSKKLKDTRKEEKNKDSEKPGGMSESRWGAPPSKSAPDAKSKGKKPGGGMKESRWA